jgi:lysophospholipase L1-like esterase
MIGTNDSIGMESLDNPQTSIEEYARNVGLILKWATKSGAKVVLFEIPPVHEQRFASCFNPNSKFQTNDNIKKFNEMLKKVANVYGVNVISNDCYLQNKDENYELDGAHLSIKGHEIFAKRWLNETAKLF